MAGEKAKSMSRPVIISPAENLEFCLSDDPNDADPYDFITITNTLPCPIAYKVKTTDPKKYRVRHSFGKIAPGQFCEITVILHKDEAKDMEKDKFLVQAIQLQDISCDLRKSWRRATPESIMEYRLKCVTSTVPKLRAQPSKSSSDMDGSLYTHQLETINQQICGLQGTNQQLNRRLRLLTLTHMGFALVIAFMIGVAAYAMVYGLDSFQIPFCANSDWLSCKPSSF